MKDRQMMQIHINSLYGQAGTIVLDISSALAPHRVYAASRGSSAFSGESDERRHLQYERPPVPEIVRSERAARNRAGGGESPGERGDCRNGKVSGKDNAGDCRPEAQRGIQRRNRAAMTAAQILRP